MSATLLMIRRLNITSTKEYPQAQQLSWLAKANGKNTVFKTALHNRKGVTLDIDANEIIANKSSAGWTYKKNKDFISMVDHIAKTGQIISCDFCY